MAKEPTGAERLKALRENNLKADDVREEYPQEKLVSLDPETLKQIVDAVAKQFEDQLKEADDKIEKMRILLEKQDATQHLKARGQFADSGKVQVKGSRVPIVPDHQSSMVKVAMEDNDLSGKHLRFVNNNPNIRSMRRAQGYEPVRLKDGNEVRYMDGVLMSMPIRRYDEEIKGPKLERREFMRSSVKTQFQERLRDFGVEAEGDITYDSGDEIGEISQVAQIETGKPVESQGQ